MSMFKKVDVKGHLRKHKPQLAKGNSIPVFK